MESLVYCGQVLWIYLSLLFTFCIQHSYLHNSMIEIEFIPLVKDKSGDITDVNNYRAIALANVETKLLESVILDKVKMDNNYNDYQFGFLKKGHSTVLLCALLQFSRLLSTILTEVVMFSHVLSISARHLITLTTRSSLNVLLPRDAYA